MGLKMGIHNKITPERWSDIKATWERFEKKAINDAKVAEMCDIGKTTARNVRLSKTYYEYRLLTDKTLKRVRHRPITVISNCGIAYEDYAKKGKPIQKITHQDASDKYYAIGMAIMGAIGLLVLGVIGVVKIIFGG